MSGKEKKKKLFWFAGDFYSYEILVTFIATKLRERGEESFYCVLAWWERWEGANPRWRTVLVLVVPFQTFQLDFKHFSSENELSGTFSSIK